MKRYYIVYLALCVILVTMSSCSTIFCGTKAKVLLDDTKMEQSVNITTDVEHHTNVNLPYTVKVKRGKKPSTITVESDGYRPMQLIVNKKFNAISVINLTNWVGWVVDVATGSMMRPEKNVYTFHMEKDNAPSGNWGVTPTDTQQQYASNTPPAQTYNQQPAYNNISVNNTTTAPAKRSSDVDINIPVTNKKADNTFVLVIANENYEFVDNVQFAHNDGEAFREYCIKTLGVPERQVWLYKDATGGIIAGGVDKMLQAMSIFDNCNVIVYYCGHGIPDDSTGDAYIIPTDGKGTNTATCYSLNRLYKTLSSANAKSVTYFMDACFSGANRDGSMLVAARGVAREAKKEVITGNTVVFSAASGDETAMPYMEKQHGMFTYFLLKKLKETKGNVTYGELAEYIKTNVKKEAFLTNEKPQNPVVATSATSSATWKAMKF